MIFGGSPRLVIVGGEGPGERFRAPEHVDLTVNAMATGGHCLLDFQFNKVDIALAGSARSQTLESHVTAMNGKRFADHTFHRDSG